MEVITTSRVQQALPWGCMLVMEKGVNRPSRDGQVRVLPTPMCTTYTRPVERVLFYPERNANPFFHLMEALWMLGGRNDVAWIKHFSENIASYSDDGVTFNGAYGWRWRQHFNLDQLQVIAARLKLNPDDRRQVLSMWDGHQDLARQHTKDVPCNLAASVQVGVTGKLDITVFNRSNDLIWGAHGANAVQFSVLQEVLAAMVGTIPGDYHQVSANTHIYDRHWAMAEKLARRVPDIFKSGQGSTDWDPYESGLVYPRPMVGNIAVWFQDLRRFLNEDLVSTPDNPFFQQTAGPMRDAWNLYKEEDKLEEAVQAARLIAAPDWRMACVQWLERVQKAREAKK